MQQHHHHDPAGRMADDALTGILGGVLKLAAMLVMGVVFGIVELVRYLTPKDTSLKLPLASRFAGLLPSAPLGGSPSLRRRDEERVFSARNKELQ